MQLVQFKIQWNGCGALLLMDIRRGLVIVDPLTKVLQFSHEHPSRFMTFWTSSQCAAAWEIMLMFIASEL